jgi:hypothetical protein
MMKTPDSRPRFQSATRHYHRYREENRDGWSEWITQKPTARKGKRWIWLTSATAICGLVAWGAIALLG